MPYSPYTSHYAHKRTNLACHRVQIHLASNNLRGTLPTDIWGALAPTLQLLDLSSNLIGGILPHTLTTGLARLHTLYLEPKIDDRPEWSLKGTLPANMGSSTGLPNLRYLGLCRNRLTGPIPASLGELPCHVTHASGEGHDDPSVRGQVGCLIWLMNNNLTGAVPRGMCNATYNEVYVSGNDLSCPRPCVSVAYGAWPSCPQKCTPC